MATCPSCQSRVADASAYCGVCGAPVGTPSLFDLPAMGRARRVKIALVLAIDLVLAGAGVAMIVSYLADRRAVAAPAAGVVQPPAAPAPRDEVEVERPRVVGTRPRGDGPPGQATPPGRPRKPPGVDPVPARADAGVAIAVPTPADASPVFVPEVPADAAPRPRDPADAAPAAPGEPDAAPSLSADEASLADGVQATVLGHMGQVQRCWQNAAKGSAEENAPTGVIELEFAVTPEGRAEGIRVARNETGSAELGDCIVALAQTWQFPTHRGDPVVFVWPFLFRTAK